MNCKRKRTDEENRSRGFFSRLFCDDEIVIPCQYEIVHQENGEWVKEDFGYYSDGAYCRHFEITPTHLLKMPGFRKMTDRLDCFITIFRSVKIKRCLKCGDIDNEYSELPLGI